MSLMKQAWGAVAPRLKPSLVLEAARRLLDSPMARTIRATLRRRIEEALREGAVETLVELMRRVRPAPDHGGEEGPR